MLVVQGVHLLVKCLHLQLVLVEQVVQLFLDLLPSSLQELLFFFDFELANSLLDTLCFGVAKSGQEVEQLTSSV